MKIKLPTRRTCRQFYFGVFSSSRLELDDCHCSGVSERLILMSHIHHHHLLKMEKKLIELSTLRVFLAAAEEKNFSNAAKRLHLSQSAVSQNIQSMERAYGVDLFIRHGRVVELTEAGQSILPMARDVLRAARLLEDGFQEINHQVGGELLIGCSTSAGKYLLPVLLSDFQREYPSVHPRVKVMGRDGVYDRLLNQSVPIGVSSKYFDHRDLESVPLFDDRIYLIVPANHPWADLWQSRTRRSAGSAHHHARRNVRHLRNRNAGIEGLWHYTRYVERIDGTRQS